MPGPVGQSPATVSVVSIDVGYNPEFATYDSGNGYVYVPNPASNNVSVINGTKVVASVNAGTYPRSAAYDSGNGYVYVVNRDSNNVSVINGTKVVGSVKVGALPYFATYDSGNGYIYVANYNSNNVSVINGTKLVGSVNVGAQPWPSATYDSGNGYDYITNSGSDNVSVISGTKAIASVNVGNFPESAAYDSGNGDVYVPNYGSNNVSVIIGTKVVGSVKVGTNPMLATYDSGNGYIYVSNSGSNNVSVINGTKVVASVNVGSPPYEAGTYDSGNGYVYLANYGSNNVSVINGTKSVASVNVGYAPAFATYDSGNGYVYVPNYNSNNVSAIFTWFPVTFTESGLPTGTGWWVNVTGGPSIFSTTTALSFSEPNGIHSYSVSTLNKTYASPGGSFNLDGTGVSETVAFSRVTYSVNFTETGLPAGTNWSVTLGGSTLSLTTTTITFLKPNGTYLYSIGSVSGWSTPTYTGSIRVNGAGFAQSVAWTQVTYLTTFSETGLPYGTTWSVNVTGGHPAFSSSNFLRLSEPNGTYWYTLGAVSGYSTSPTTRLLTVSGADQTVSVLFKPQPTYTVDFAELGLPSGTSWSIELGGAQHFSTTTTIAFKEQNGSYVYSIGSVSGYTLIGPTTKVLVVQGKNASVDVVFQQTIVLANLTFRATGLPAGANWSLNLSALSSGSSIAVGTSLTRWSDGGATISFKVSNGNFSYTAAISGYRATPGTLTVTGGASTNVTVSFVPSRSNGAGPASSSLPFGWVGGVGLAFAIVGAVGLAATIYRSRAREAERARLLVAGIYERKWMTDGAGQPVARTRR